MPSRGEERKLPKWTQCREGELSGGSLGAPAYQRECAWEHRHAVALPGAGSPSEQLEHRRLHGPSPDLGSQDK